MPCDFRDEKNAKSSNKLSRRNFEYKYFENSLQKTLDLLQIKELNGEALNKTILLDLINNGCDLAQTFPQMIKRIDNRK
jgi:hypothetical protein